MKITRKKAEDLLKEVMQEARNLNIPISCHIHHEVQINSRAKSRFACCREKKSAAGSTFVIEVGSMLFECGEKEIKGILAHEILHTCRGCYNHGRIWKSYAQKMNEAYGYQIKRTSTYEELGLKRDPKVKTIRYEIVCQHCGATFYRQKKSRLVTHTKQYRCKCGGKLICKDVTESKIK